MKKDLNYIDDLVKSKLDDFRVENPAPEFASEWEKLSKNLVENNLSTGAAASTGKVGTSVFSKISGTVVKFVVNKIYIITIAAVSTVGITIYANIDNPKLDNNQKQEKPIVKDSTSTEQHIEQKNSEKELLNNMNEAFKKLQENEKAEKKNIIKPRIEKQKDNISKKSNIAKENKKAEKKEPIQKKKVNIKKIKKIIKVKKKIIVRDTLKYFDTLRTFRKK